VVAVGPPMLAAAAFAGISVGTPSVIAHIVLAQGKTTPQPNLSAETNAAFARIWNDLQHDLATRSPQGQYRRAEQSGHFVHLDQPDLVIQALRELSPPQ
jgi:hypothetical protein